jgi:hypothetical protein
MRKTKKRIKKYTPYLESKKTKTKDVIIIIAGLVVIIVFFVLLISLISQIASSYIS